MSPFGRFLGLAFLMFTGVPCRGDITARQERSRSSLVPV